MPELLDPNRHVAFQVWLDENFDDLRSNYRALLNAGHNLPSFMLWANGEWLED
jgi:hypothetical protein